MLGQLAVALGLRQLSGAAAGCSGRLHSMGLAAAAAASTSTSRASYPWHWFSTAAAAPEAGSAARAELGAGAGMSTASSSQGQPSPSEPQRPAVAFGSRRLQRGEGEGGARRSNQPIALEGIIHIQNTFNNLKMVLTGKDGHIRAWTSAGTAGFKGSRKSQPVAAERAAEELARRALKLGYTSVDIKLKGPGNNKQYAVQALRSTGLVITSLADVTPIPYNGCRPPRRRRV